MLKSPGQKKPTTNPKTSEEDAHEGDSQVTVRVNPERAQDPLDETASGLRSLETAIQDPMKETRKEIVLLMNPNQQELETNDKRSYEVLEELGVGGYGIVYKAKNPEGMITALKVIFPEANKHVEMQMRTELETKVLSLLSQHTDGIPKVYGQYVQNGNQVIEMECIEGETLKDLIEEGRLAESLEENPSNKPFANIVECFRTLSETLQTIHERGFIHRDFKPQNIIIRDDTKQPTLIDFGLVKVDPSPGTAQSRERQLDPTTLAELDPGITDEADLLGTPYMMAPEYIRMNDTIISPAMDVYALGVSLFNALTDRYPFDGVGALEVLQSHLTDPVPDIRSMNPSIPLELSEIINRILIKNPQQRPSAAELRQLFDDYLNG